MRKTHALIAAGLVLLSGCGGTSSDREDYFAFKAKNSVLVGSFNQSYYDVSQIRTIVGNLACQSGNLSSFNTTPTENGLTQFAAECAGSVKYQGFSGYTVYGNEQKAYTTTNIDGRLVQIVTDINNFQQQTVAL